MTRVRRLGRIVIVAVSGMIKTQRLKELYALRRTDFVLAAVALLAVLSLETLTALIASRFSGAAFPLPVTVSLVPQGGGGVTPWLLALGFVAARLKLPALLGYLLAGVLVYVCAPLIVTTWVAWREGRRAPSVAE